MHSPKLSRSQRSIEYLVDVQIQNHPKYRSNIQRAVDMGKPLSLNYHSGHSKEGKFCVSICTGKNKDDELCHIAEFGKNKQECGPLMSMLGKKLEEFYNLGYTPKILLNNQPFEEENEPLAT